MNKLLFWLLVYFLITLFSGLVYVSIQQVLRQSANDPQIQLAHDLATSLNNKGNPLDYQTNSKLDMRQSLATFVIIYDKSGKPVASTVQLDGKTPSLPKGVFEFVKKNGEERLTWEPDSNVREASVIVGYDNGFVLAGRSLKEVEIREDMVMKLSILAWIVGIGATSFVFALTQLKKK